jgi:diacylglycerol kinase (ATP)
MDEPLASMKNRPFRERLGFALLGILLVFRRERSFRTQCTLAAALVAAMLAFRPDPVWVGMAALAIGLVLALELINASIEYVLDHLHPALAAEVKAAKDAAAGAVLIASLAALCVGAGMLLSSLP